MLRARAEAFSAARQDATVLIFSSWDVFSRILSGPPPSPSTETARSYKKLFVNGCHTSSHTHAFIATDLEVSLCNNHTHGHGSGVWKERVKVYLFCTSGKLFY